MQEDWEDLTLQLCDEVNRNCLKSGEYRAFPTDNGSEFAEHIELRQILGLKTYFADPHSPWQRPTNENTNGLIREFYPKKFDFSTVTQQEVDKVSELINNRPKKCLRWYSAAKVFRIGIKIIEEGVVDISNKDKAEVLASLYNNSHPHGMGFLQYNPAPMTIKEAQELLQQTTHFNYLFGRVMKIRLDSNIVHTWGYNRDSGAGAAERAISQCRNI